ncbi:MAG: hypothetical protein ACXVEE_08990 [Polyangiales bacterium]
MATKKMVVMGVFEDQTHAERALTRLDAVGIDRKALSLMAHPGTVQSTSEEVWKPENKLTHALEPKSGAMTGALAWSATLLGIALWAVPLGALIVSAPVALIGGAVAAFGAPLLSPDTLGDLGVPRRDAKLAIEAIRRGAIVLVVQAEYRQIREAAEAMDRAGAIDLYQRAAEWEAEGWSHEPNAPLWTKAQIEHEYVLRHPMRGIPRESAPSYT